MRDRELTTLKRQLLRSGVAPRHVRRLIVELRDHIEDLECEAAALGISAIDARKVALKRIGEQQLLAAHISEQTEFKSWFHRHPRIARVCLPIAYATVLPATPVFLEGADVTKASLIVRWGACLILGALATYLMLFIMQLSLTLT